MPCKELNDSRISVKGEYMNLKFTKEKRQETRDMSYGKRFAALKTTMLTLLCLSMSLCLYGYSVFNLYLGSDIVNHDARVSALGGTGVAGGFSFMDSSINPANLFFMSEIGTIQIDYSLIKNSESRSLPMWNFFDSYIGQSTYARNENFYNEISFGGYYTILKNFKIGASMRPVLNFGADYYEEVRNDLDSNDDKYPPILAKNFIESKGILNSGNLLLNWGMPIHDINISIGAELSYYAGTHEYERRIHWTEDAHELATVVLGDDYLYETKNEIDGIGFKLGLAAQVTERSRIGITYSPKASLNSDFSINDQKQDNTSDFILPSKLRFGFLYMPRNPFRTNFHVDFEMINYEEIDKFFEDGYAFYVGMEHYVGRAIPFRLGFSHRTAKQDKSIALPTISAGTGFGIINNLHLDISAEYGIREYIDLDLFPDSYYDKAGLWRQIRPADRDWSNPDNVSESFFKIFTSLSYKW